MDSKIPFYAIVSTHESTVKKHANKPFSAGIVSVLLV